MGGQLENVEVVYTKYDGSLHWHHHARRLGEDRFGTWLGCVPGGRMQRGQEPPIAFSVAFVMLVPRDGWWTACFNDAPHKYEIYCDITSLPRWTTGDRVTMADLDLDVIRRRDGSVFVDDEDEFAEHQVRYGYPPDVVSGARTTADRLEEAVTRREGPFDGAHEAWLSRVTG
ncbi:DUF402 domain-containing protein [Streptantibioticus parmotrematis]|uniref:DUF402 domain-containing protein n=1 Tax=Streptantibioticus parmotrematis TaxID=2873249 RepID=UPI0033CC8521